MRNFLHLAFAGISSIVANVLPLTFCCCSSDPPVDRGKKPGVKQSLLNRTYRVLDRARQDFGPYSSAIAELKRCIERDHPRCHDADTFERSVIYDIDHADLPGSVSTCIKQQIFGVSQ